MKIRKFIVLEECDANVIDRIRDYGVRRMAKDCGLSASMVCRWLKGQTGMDYAKAVQAMKIVPAAPKKRK